MVTKRNGFWYIYSYPFKGKKIGIKLPDVKTKGEAKQVEAVLLRACRSGEYSGMDAVSREACARMFQNQGWELPPELAGAASPRQELTLWKCVEICLAYPEVCDSPNKERHKQAFIHLVEKWGKDFPVRSIWIPEIKQYQIDRSKEGAAASTINKERAALSKMFQVLTEMGLLHQNPVRLVKGPSDRDGRREVYVSFKDFNKIVSNLPAWVRPIVQTLYFSGMRRSEVLGLTWDNVNLKARIIRLHAHQTKERQQKRIPIHRLLVPILKTAGKVRSISTDRVFLIDQGKPPCEDSLRKPWTQAVKAARVDSAFTIRDIRHVWKTNATRSGIDFEIREAIMGHSIGIAGRYGRFSDDDLVRAINPMRFDRGRTEIWVARPKKENPEEATSGKNSNSVVTETLLSVIQEKRGHA
jgi:integrase